MPIHALGSYTLVLHVPYAIYYTIARGQQQAINLVIVAGNLLKISVNL